MPIILLIILNVFSIGVDAERHGEPRTGKYNVLTTIISAIILQTILWWGGWYD